jgi:hypothetical protein
MEGEKVIEVLLLDLAGEYVTIDIALPHVRVFEEPLPPPRRPSKSFGGFLFSEIYFD